MGAGLFERAKLERKSDAEKTTDQVLVGRVAAALDWSADAGSVQSSGGKPGGDMYAGMATYWCALQRFCLDLLGPGGRLPIQEDCVEEYNSLVDD